MAHALVTLAVGSAPSGLRLPHHTTKGDCTAACRRHHDAAQPAGNGGGVARGAGGCCTRCSGRSSPACWHSNIGVCRHILYLGQEGWEGVAYIPVIPVATAGPLPAFQRYKRRRLRRLALPCIRPPDASLVRAPTTAECACCLMQGVQQGRLPTFRRLVRQDGGGSSPSPSPGKGGPCAVPACLPAWPAHCGACMQ